MLSGRGEAAGLVKPENESEAQEGAAATHNAAADVQAPEEVVQEKVKEEVVPERAPDFLSDQVNEQQLLKIIAETDAYVKLNGKLSTDRAKMASVSLMTDLANSLKNVYSEKFTKWKVQDNLPQAWIDKQTVNLDTMLPEAQETMLEKTIMPSKGYLMK